MIDRSLAAGDPIAYAAEREAYEELAETAGRVLDWLRDREAHLPEKLLDGREAKHRKRLRGALRRVGEAKAYASSAGGRSEPSEEFRAFLRRLEGR